MLHCLFARAEEEFTRCASCGNRAAKAHLTAPRRGEAAQRLIGAASRFHARTWRRCWACGSAAGFMRCICRNSNSTAVAQQPPASSSSSVGPGCILCIPDVQPAKDRVHGHGPRLPVPEGGLVNARANRDRGGAKDSAGWGTKPIFCRAQRLAELCAPEQHFVAEERASKPVLPLSCPDDHKPQQQNTEQRRARGNAPVVPTCRAARVNVLNSLISLCTFLCRRGGPKRAWTFQIDSRFQPRMRPVGGRKIRISKTRTTR
jgi:hypothetical protein